MQLEHYKYTQHAFLTCQHALFVHFLSWKSLWCHGNLWHYRIIWPPHSWNIRAYSLYFCQTLCRIIISECILETSVLNITIHSVPANSIVSAIGLPAEHLCTLMTKPFVKVLTVYTQFNSNCSSPSTESLSLPQRMAFPSPWDKHNAYTFHLTLYLSNSVMLFIHCTQTSVPSTW